VARLFSDKIMLTDPKACVSNAYLIDSMIVDNIIILLRREKYPVYEKIYFMNLLGQLCSLSGTIRNKIIEIGGG
jgi:hypothetical protein